MSNKIRVLLGKLGVDVHNRGIITVANMLRDAGMEVIYIGNALPGQIVNTALQEAVDVVGVSSLGGAHITLGVPLVQEAREKGLAQDAVFVMGGVFPPQDETRLKQEGFDAVFKPGDSKSEIIAGIQRLCQEKLQQKSHNDL